MRLLAFLRGALHHQSKISSQDADAACGIIKYISVFTSHHNTTPCRRGQTPKDGDHAGRWDGTCVSRAFELVICKPVGDDAQRPFLQRRQRTQPSFSFFVFPGGYCSPCFWRSLSFDFEGIARPKRVVASKKSG